MIGNCLLLFILNVQYITLSFSIKPNESICMEFVLKHYFISSRAHRRTSYLGLGKFVALYILKFFKKNCLNSFGDLIYFNLFTYEKQWGPANKIVRELKLLLKWLFGLACGLYEIPECMRWWVHRSKCMI